MIACLEVRWCPSRVSELNMPSAELSEGTSWCYFLAILLVERSTWSCASVGFSKFFSFFSSDSHCFSFCLTTDPLWFSIHPVVYPSLSLWINFSICFFLVLENYLSFKIHSWILTQFTSLCQAELSTSSSFFSQHSLSTIWLFTHALQKNDLSLSSLLILCWT